jgi:hypothetical protein
LSLVLPFHRVSSVISCDPEFANTTKTGLVVEIKCEFGYSNLCASRHFEEYFSLSVGSVWTYPLLHNSSRDVNALNLFCSEKNFSKVSPISLAWHGLTHSWEECTFSSINHTHSPILGREFVERCHPVTSDLDFGLNVSGFLVG